MTEATLKEAQILVDEIKNLKYIKQCMTSPGLVVSMAKTSVVYAYNDLNAEELNDITGYISVLINKFISDREKRLEEL